MSDTNIYQRLLEVQRKGIAPREVDGKFGKARSAEQILEAYKPLCNTNGLYLFTDDDIQDVNGRNYVTSTATVVNVDKPAEQHSARASAWENEVEKNKYGQAILDTSQVTGKTGSYAKKYALQNLFAIDDTKDADSKEYGAEAAPASSPTSKPAVGTAKPPTAPSDTTVRRLVNEAQGKLLLARTRDATGLTDRQDVYDAFLEMFSRMPNEIYQDEVDGVLKQLKEIAE